MATTNILVSASWTKLANSGDADALVTWNHPVAIEVATTTADAPPTVWGHVLRHPDAITRGVLGPGYIWAKLSAGTVPASILVVVSK